MIFRYCNIAISNDLWWQVGWVLCISWDLPASGHVPVSLMYSFAINIYPRWSPYIRVGMFTSSQFYPLYSYPSHMTWLYLNYIPSYIPPQLRRVSRQRLIERISLFGISSRGSQVHVSLTQDDQAAWLEFWLGLVQTGLIQSRFPNVIYNGYDVCMYILLRETRPDSVCWNSFLHLNKTKLTGPWSLKHGVGDVRPPS